jgi:Na+/glutamate symporter
MLDALVAAVGAGFLGFAVGLIIGIVGGGIFAERYWHRSCLDTINACKQSYDATIKHRVDG